MLLACWLFLASSPLVQLPWPPASPLEQVEKDDSAIGLSSVQVSAIAGGRWRCTFRYRGHENAAGIVVLGSFNQWNRGQGKMKRQSGAWTCTLTLDSGIHDYKFLVDGHLWLPDPENPEGRDDGHGGLNSVLRLGRLATWDQSPGKVGDGRAEVLAFLHQADSSTFIQAHGRDRIWVRFRSLSHDLESVQFVAKGRTPIAMQKALVGPLFTLWEASIPRLNPGHPYTFLIQDGKLQARVPDLYALEDSQTEDFLTPDWAKKAIWYQIMVDRFRNGDPSNDPDPVRPWTSSWFRKSPWEGKDGQSFYKYFVYRRHYGGDLQGLLAGLDYLQDLGVTALYLNPVFKAASHHKYDTTNYIHVDDHFGVRGDYHKAVAKEDLLDPSTWIWTESDRLFLQFLRTAKAKGFRVIIDGVFNHVGVAHPAFQDLKKNGRKSRFRDWFHVTSFKPFRYRGWGGYGELPEFKKSEDGFASDEIREHIFAVTRRWMDPNGDGDPSDGVDGWRLDVPNEVPAPFWRDWRKLVKEINPEAYISGEIWTRAEDWLDGRHFDAVMNYEFAKTSLAWIGHKEKKIDAEQCDRQLAELRMAYPSEATYALQNLVDSHDTDRLVSMMLNPDRPYDGMNRPQDNGKGYDNSKPSNLCYQKARLVALLQMTYVGAPMIYYGDEVGMWGADDPTNRKPMLWKDLEPYEQPEENFVMEEHRQHYRKIIALRKAYPALQTGSFRTLSAEAGSQLWAFERRQGDEVLRVVLNASEQEQKLNLPAEPGEPKRWRLVYGSTGALVDPDGGLQLTLPALDGLVLLAD
ncbi:MAG: DUF3459 domain-containing protein [Planctomycetota bacterium]|nr:MAG: DUF3459 domain-containing protein [Planctomycetota bacterium]